MSALLFGFINIIVIFLLEIPIFYFLIKAFYKSVKLIDALKALLLYELFYFIFACFYPAGGTKFFCIVSPFIVLIVSFGLFFLATKLTKLIEWKQWGKGIVLFVLMFVIIAPVIIPYLTNTFIFNPIAQNLELSGEMELSDLFNPFYQKPLGWMILEKMNLSVTNSLFSQSVVNFIFNVFWAIFLKFYILKEDN